MSTSAIVFPGQGSQHIGMLSELAQDYPLVTAIFEEVSDHVQYDVWQLVQEGPLERLNQTEHTQVAMLTADVAVFRVLEQRLLLDPSIVLAGHSLGEYAALVCADVLSLADAAKLVRTRGRLMQETIPMGHGAMAAIVGLNDAAVLAICDEVSVAESAVMPANYNAIGQVVIAGHTEAVEKAMLLAEAQDARLVKLIPVSVPCHCDLLKPAAELFFYQLKAVTMHKPKRPVVSTVDLGLYDAESHTHAILAEQLYRPVRWVETIQWMRQQGISLILECGPGKVLSGLVKRIDKSMMALSMFDKASILAAEAELLSRGEGVLRD